MNLSLLVGLVVACTANLAHAATSSTPVQFWWPGHLDLSSLRSGGADAGPQEETFDYGRAFEGLDMTALKADIRAVLTTSQSWWPADYGHYGPFFIRMAWHSAGTYRISDGRGGADGGQQRFEPLNSWPDNGNLDKARRLLWPLKQKYGQSISWADLMILSSNVALEDMGLKTFGFAGGRRDDWQPDLSYWGPEKVWLADRRHNPKKQLDKPLAAAQMGLIYVNPQGPHGRPDPQGSAGDIRDIFGRMAMNDEETVALIAGGHTFGKTHGAHDAGKCLGPEPAASGPEAQGFGWQNSCGKGHGGDAITSGLEGAWTDQPTRWTSAYLDNLFAHDWVKTKSPAGAVQWVPKKMHGVATVPDAHDAKKRHPPVMLTTDLALKADPAYRAIALSFQQDPARFEAAFARAWFKLTHRDMGPRSRYLGPEVPQEALIWQDPVPACGSPPLSREDLRELKARILASAADPAALVRLAWGSAASFRGTDKRGGANGGRLRLAPQKDWPVNTPAEAAVVLGQLEDIRRRFRAQSNAKKDISTADLIVLAGSVAIEQAAKKAGLDVEVPFSAGRTDADEGQTDVASFAALEPTADGFRNYYVTGQPRTAEQMLIERAGFLTLTVPEMTVLVGGLRALGANTNGSRCGVLTSRPGTLSNDFFVNLLDMSTTWSKSSSDATLFEGRERSTGKLRWKATSVDLLFGSHSELRAVAEFYAERDGQERLVRDFVRTWAKVMNLDRFELGRS